jgi:hypothetical protein
MITGVNIERDLTIAALEKSVFDQIKAFGPVQQKVEPSDLKIEYVDLEAAIKELVELEKLNTI